MKRLNVKQRNFLKYIIQGYSQTDSYIKAYDVKYDRKIAGIKATQLFKNPLIVQKYKELVAKIDSETVISTSAILNELMAIAFSNGSKYAKLVKGKIIYEDTENLTEDEKKAISQISYSKFGINVSTYDKVKALELLGKYKGLFKEQTLNKTIVMTPEDYLKDCQSDNEY